MTPKGHLTSIEPRSTADTNHWDSVLLGARVEAGVDIVFTEDMGAPTMAGSVRHISPF